MQSSLIIIENYTKKKIVCVLIRTPEVNTCYSKLRVLIIRHNCGILIKVLKYNA